MRNVLFKELSLKCYTSIYFRVSTSLLITALKMPLSKSCICSLPAHLGYFQLTCWTIVVVPGLYLVVSAGYIQDQRVIESFKYML